MKLRPTIVTAFSMLATGLALAQAQASSPGPHAASPQGSQTIQVIRIGLRPATVGPAERFTGVARVESLFTADATSQVSGGRVTFEPGSRTAWHSHPLGQTLIVTAGSGLVQQWGGQIQEIRQGDVVLIPPGQKHWHGAAANSGMTHIAIQESLNGKAVDWMEKVSDEQYRNSNAPSGATMSATQEPSAAQKLFGDFDPKLAELTDKVLFADVWERPGLGKRDRSLITVAALIAMNRPEQLRHHLQRARDNGVTKEEVVEVITHLAFYAGWPNAISAIGIAKEVFKDDVAK